ncbi:AAA family ATPase [Blastochloris sulfoviridis]|uniref:AAA family ATPase n=1 Tax=Blastochloris sulfoviridis TaxID=50712 RepID=A0A5M6I593_9HYPH|nr:AAA family ATPase [Blastochloris sulfoviridis]KAA5603390.1 AAA family ATPase [Blastochloris sulfoviridis]NJL08533.1 AAA family ATPase [Candidatus Methylacidiphilales bacterium]
MDPIRNPYAPGAGTPPPELAGRSEVLTAGTVALKRIASGRPSQSLILVGLRGVGKTVLLNKLRDTADEIGFKSAFIEAHEGKSLPELIVPSLRSILYYLSIKENAKEKARRGLRALKGFLGNINIKIGDFEVGLSVDPERGLADSGNLESDLPDLIAAIGEAAKDGETPVVLLVDELQYLSPAEFSALIMSIHRVNQRDLPLVMVGAGLPQIHGLAGTSKSYAERLFRFPEIGALERQDAIAAIANPATAEDVYFEDEAIERILQVTERYPYFLQQWAYEAWNASESSRISLGTVDVATRMAIRELDRSFFKVRFDRCTPSEKKYMRALAEFGHGKHRSGDVAEKLGVKVTSVAPTRSALIKKGMIYSPSHGDTAFTVPLFDDYMRRVMPLG